MNIPRESASDRVFTETDVRLRKQWDEMHARPEEEPRATLTAPPLPTSPAALFGCKQKGEDLTGARCLELQERPPPEDEYSNAYVADRFCSSGECMQGARVRAALERMKARRLCTKCQRVQLGDSNTDGLCSKCRPPEPEAEAPRPRLSTVLVPVQLEAPRQPAAAFVQPKPATPAPPPEMKMETEEKKTCANPTCGKKLRSDNTKGVCGACQQNGWRPKDGAEPAAKKSPATPPARISVKVDQLDVEGQLELPGAPPAAALPDLRTVPTDYLVAGAKELIRRKEEIVTALAEISELGIA